MSRLDWFTIAVVAICISAILFLIYRVGALQDNEEKTNSDATTIVDDRNDDNLDDSDIYTDETIDPDGDFADEDADFISTDDEDASMDDDSSAASGEQENDSLSDDENDNSADDESFDDEPKINTSPSSDASLGKYMVVAGSFQQMLNAENFVSKLRGMGYSNAVVGKFNAGKYATALADRFDNPSDAQALVTELKGKGIDAFIQTKK